jgi:hypothetical protein
MRRPAVIASLVALLAVAPSTLAQPRELMPGVTYEEQLQFTSHGPVVVHVLMAPRPGGLYSVKPVLSNESILGRETVTSMQRRLSVQATVAGINGDFFSAADGHPTGILMRNGALEHRPVRERSSIGIDTTGTLRVDRVALLGTWQGSGQRRAVNEINAPPGPNGVSLFTPAWGPTTPAAPGTVELTIAPFPTLVPNGELTGPATQVGGGGNTAIPPDGVVLVARGTAATRLQAEAPAGQPVRIRLILRPDWAGVVQAIGGGPVLVRESKPVFRAPESFTTDQLVPRGPRAAVGQLADGRIVMVTVDGRLPGFSTGMTNFELAQTLVRLGAVTGSALDGGGSATMAFEGQLLNRPSDPGGEREVAEGLFIAYEGVHVDTPAELVVSPNGDGVAEEQALSYKLVRTSAVTEALIGPDGVSRYAFTGERPPGVYPLVWNARREDGTAELEGLWRWTVAVTDDLGRASNVEKTFTLNQTLGFPQGVGPALVVPRKLPRAVASFTLIRPATVTARIETPAGTVLRRLGRQAYEAGQVEVAWDGRTGKGGVVYSGSYVARVIATNELGSVGLTRAFKVRRLPGPLGLAS